MSAVADNRYPQAVLLSTLLHAAVIALLFFFTYFVRHQVKESPAIIELVRGEGDNYAAREAPALGSPDAVKLDVPEMPKSVPAPTPVAPPEPEPATPPPAPIEAVPVPTTPPPKPVPTPNLTQAVRRIEQKDRQNNAKIRAAEQKKAKEEAARTMTKEEFDKLNKGKSNPTVKPGPAPKIPLVGAGIAKGVAGGSTANKDGGAGGTAMTREDGELMQAYYAMFKDRLFKAIEPPPGVSDRLVASVSATITASGAITGGKITDSSGSDEFDRAILAALGRVRMAARPDHQSGVVNFDVHLRDLSGP